MFIESLNIVTLTRVMTIKILKYHFYCKLVCIVLFHLFSSVNFINDYKNDFLQVNILSLSKHKKKTLTEYHSTKNKTNTTEKG